MCGIIGYIGENDNASRVVRRGLETLEYRGYDSCGVAFFDKDSSDIKMFRAIGPPSELSEIEVDSFCGIGHTRWATHGAVTIDNAHPHYSQDKEVYLVHNGVIENAEEIKKFLTEKGCEFYGETDSEILVNLIAYHDKANVPPLGALKKSLNFVEGTYGLAVLFKSENGSKIYAGRRSSPLVVGVGENGHFIASDAIAIPGHVDRIAYLEDGQIAVLSEKEFKIHHLDGKKPLDGTSLSKKIKPRKQQVDLGEHFCYMEKEIFEQPNSIRESLRGRLGGDFESIKLGGIDLDKEINRVLLIGCGTAYHAALLGKYYMENIANIPASVEFAHEYKYKSNPTEEGTLVIAVSQSGETIDTLGAVQEALKKGLDTMAITNTVSSSVAREVTEGIYQRIGPEISVASTKAFTSQSVILLMLAIALGSKRHLNALRVKKYINEIRKLPALIEETLLLEEKMRGLSKRYSMSNEFNFLGRQYTYPIALEGALKLKELSYLSCSAYPIGEMKHGPLATIRHGARSFFIAPQADLKDKNISNAKEIKARGGRIFLITQRGLEFPKDCHEELIEIPAAPSYISAILSVIPLQMFSMYMTIEKGYNVDRPRNLAKSVTVE